MMYGILITGSSILWLVLSKVIRPYELEYSFLFLMATPIQIFVGLMVMFYDNEKTDKRKEDLKIAEYMKQERLRREENL